MTQNWTENSLPMVMLASNLECPMKTIVTGWWLTWLTYPSENMKVNGKDDIPYMMENLENIWHHQPGYISIIDHLIHVKLELCLSMSELCSQTSRFRGSGGPPLKAGWCCHGASFSSAPGKIGQATNRWQIGGWGSEILHQFIGGKHPIIYPSGKLT